MSPIKLARRRLTPSRLFAGSFALLILVGTLGLKSIPGLYVGEPLSWLDALFTATSAVCVTGLTVVDTASCFTPWGQGYLLLLIQLGGLGIITFATVIIRSLGRRPWLQYDAIAADAAKVTPTVDFRQLSRNVVGCTLLFEGLGALVLYLAWIPRFGWGTAAWHAIFHSVSAFCNAGFSTFSDSLIQFQRAPGSLLTIMFLIIAGGIGFLTMEELYLWRRRVRDKKAFRLSLNARLALTTTVVLLVAGWALYTVFEWNVSLRHVPGWAKVLNGLFMSVTARTAGFNTIDYAAAAEPSDFLTILLMSIGGSPGSTAGGVKTTTMAVIGILAWSRLRGLRVTSLWKRTIPQETIQRAVGLCVLAFALVVVAIFVYTTTEIGLAAHRATEERFVNLMFEAVSAFNTVGLSMDTTSGLSPAGRVLTIFLMYVGRVGPLVFATAIARREAGVGSGFRYAYEDVALG